MGGGKVNPADPRKLTDFKALSFDVYSTLIDEPEGMFQSLHPLLNRLPPTTKPTYLQNRALTLRSFHTHEHALQISSPHTPYPQILSQALLLFSTSLSLPPPPPQELHTFSQSISSWPSFPDTIPALQRLAKYYKLVILSNIDEQSIKDTCEKQMSGVRWDKVLTAQGIGSFKPDLRNFEVLVEVVGERFGVEKGEILHTAQSLRADLVPAKKMGMNGCWIDRGDEGQDFEEMGSQAEFGWKFSTLGEMADAVEEAFEKEGKKVD